MGTPYLGEIKMISWNYAPKGWTFCNGQTLPINQNQALFSILGTTYGGNGQTTFALPDLRTRVPVNAGNGVVLGEQGGEQAVTLNINQIGHGHNVKASATATTNTAAGNFPANSPSNIYGSSSDTAMAAGIVSTVGGSQAHTNLQPYLVINFIIALQGIFPSRN
jgi:microcystin-dependent protein